MPTDATRPEPEPLTREQIAKLGYEAVTNWRWEMTAREADRERWLAAADSILALVAPLAERVQTLEDERASLVDAVNTCLREAGFGTYQARYDADLRPYIEQLLFSLNRQTLARVEAVERATRAEEENAILEEALSNAKETVRHYEAEVFTLRAQVAALTADRDATRNTRDLAFDEIAELLSEIATLRTALAAAQGEARVSESGIKALDALGAYTTLRHSDDAVTAEDWDEVYAAWQNYYALRVAALAPPAPGTSRDDR